MKLKYTYIVTLSLTPDSILKNMQVLVIMKQTHPPFCLPSICFMEFCNRITLLVLYTGRALQAF